jgi:uncharacterized protein
MARELKIPRRPRPASFYLNTAGAIGLGIFTIVSLWKKGSSGWAWLFWGMAFALLGLILRVLLETSEDSGFLGSSSGGGGFSGGSFSGGFSGGGGATGSW